MGRPIGRPMAVVCVCVGSEQWCPGAGGPSRGLGGVATRKRLEPGGKCWYRMKTNGFKKR